MKPYLISKFFDEDLYTIHILKGKCYHLLAEFTYQHIPEMLLVFSIGDIPNLLNDFDKRLQPEITRYMEQVKRRNHNQIFIPAKNEI